MFEIIFLYMISLIKLMPYMIVLYITFDFIGSFFFGKGNQ